MADVTLNHIYKVYPNGVKAVSDMCINIKDKEFIVFVGPSGCGKSTTLRMVAGLEEITTGDLFIGSNLVNDVQPKDRDIAMVFQNYALYPHMTVYENIAFSLKNRHMNKDEINKRVLEAAKVLGIEDYLQRKPKAMSGGQRQRVALGRAIVRNPKVFLLDEPLSNLDAKLRAQMRTEISKLHKKLATTFIYVTHDQVEAMTMGTRIVVMKKGFVQQVDTPTNLYDHPINKFVAGFIGTPQMNFFDVTLLKEDKMVTIAFEDGQSIRVSYGFFEKCDPIYLDGQTHVILGVRPDNVLLSKEKNSVRLIVFGVEKLGNETLLYCDLSEKVKDETVSGSSVIVRLPPSDNHKIGDLIQVEFRNSLIQVFANDTEVSVMPFEPTYSKVEVSIKGSKMSLFGQEVDRPAAFEKVSDGEHLVKIPIVSIIDGKDFSLSCSKCEFIKDNEYLVTLEVEGSDNHLFCLSPIAVKTGDSISFSVSYEDAEFDREDGIKPVTHYVEVIGHFIKRKETNKDTGKKIINFYAEAGSARYLLSETFVKRFISIEGRRSLQIDYRLRFTPMLKNDKSNTIEHSPEEVLDYGKKQYLRAKIGESENYIDITSIYRKGIEDADFSFDNSKPLEVYTIDNDVKIM